MPYTNKLYGQAMLNALKKLVSDLSAGGTDIKVMLCTSAYTPNQDTHTSKTDVTNEITGAGYTAGGAALVSKILTYDAPTNIIKFDADDVAWTGATFTARIAVVYDNTPAAAADKKLLCYIDFAADKSVEGGTFTIQWDAAGIFKNTIA